MPRRIFPERVFGLRLVHEETNEEQGVGEAMLSAPGDTGAAVQLLAPLRDDSPIAKFLEKRGPGIHHLCLKSGDIRADDARLRESGFQVLRPEPTRGAGGCWVQFVHPKSTGGVLLELSEHGE